MPARPGRDLLVDSGTAPRPGRRPGRDLLVDSGTGQKPGKTRRRSSRSTLPVTVTSSGVQRGVSRPVRRRATASAEPVNVAVASAAAGGDERHGVGHRDGEPEVAERHDGRLGQRVGLADEAEQEAQPGGVVLARPGMPWGRRDRCVVVVGDPRVPRVLGGLVEPHPRQASRPTAASAGSRAPPAGCARCSGGQRLVRRHEVHRRTRRIRRPARAVIIAFQRSQTDWLKPSPSGLAARRSRRASVARPISAPLPRCESTCATGHSRGTRGRRAAARR